MLAVRELLAAHVHAGPAYAAACLTHLDKPVSAPTLIGCLDIQAPGAEGVRRLNSVLHYVTVIPLKMTELNCKPLPQKQREMADLFIQSSLPTIVTPVQWALHQQVFLDLLGIPDSTTMGGVIGARQMGKTWTVAICCAAVLMSCPGISIGVYTSNLRQSGVIMEYIVQIYNVFNRVLHRLKTDHMIYTDGAPRSTMTCFGFNA